MKSARPSDSQPTRARTNLPRFLTSFVGRERELAGLAPLLARNRIVTLLGTGGTGKSRLAAELVSVGLGRWPEGAWWIELAPVNDPRQVAAAVASALELPGRGPAQDDVIAWIGAKRVLIIMDNCEHLVAACAEFCRVLLECCPELTILATSREALGVPGEAQWPVSPLKASDAVPLFAARAALIRPDFKIMSENLEAVTQICERVDGLPLAIELAASRLGVLTVVEILSQLSDRFALLATGVRAPERQQTMKATIDWSYRLLNDHEARLFCRLSVFRGGFTLESVQAVCAGDLAGNGLALLAGLVQKSMVVADSDDIAGTRYRLLESQLAFAEEQFQKGDEVGLIRQLHYQYFRDRLSASASPRWVEDPAAAVTERAWIDREASNLWTALAWARENAEDTGLSMVVNLTLRDVTQERALLNDVLASSPAGGALRARALKNLAYLAYAQGDFDAALQAAEGSVSLARVVGQAEPLALSLNGLAMAHIGRGELGIAAELYEEASALLDSSKDRAWAVIRNSMGILAIRRADYSTAADILTEVVNVAKAQEEWWLCGGFLDSLASAHLGRNDLKAAAECWKQAITMARDLADDLVILSSLEGLACVASMSGDDSRALRLSAAASRIARTRSLSSDPWLSLQMDSSRGRSRSRLGVPKSEEAWEQGSTMTLEQATDYALGEAESEVVSDPGPLSRREQEVVALIAAGLTNRQIGERLFIAERSAEGHVERIRSKLGVRSRTEVAVWAVAHGLAKDPNGSTADGPDTEKRPTGRVSTRRRDH